MTSAGCLACAGEEITRARAAGEDPDPSRIAPAVTWAPSAQAIRGPQGVVMAVVTVPSCLGHLAAGSTDPAVSKNGLVTA